MCGLFGFALLDRDAVPQELVERGLQALGKLDHRGPDQFGHVVLDNVFLGHTRLSVIDLSDAGRQPMLTSDEQVALTVNGEVYNHAALRKDIGEQQFRSQSDSEVLLHGYRSLGLRTLLERVDGMYAGVIYDRAERRLALFRDRVGIKPLYTARVSLAGAAAFVWASELKALAAFVDDLELDVTAILDFAAQRCIPAPKSIYRDVRKLLPAHYAECALASGRVMEHRYWKLEPQERSGTFAQFEEETRALIDTSVREQLVADVPVGLFLSGGLDSSILCEAAARHQPRISSYTIGFGVPGRDESVYARTVAEAFGTRHMEDQFTAPDAQDPFARMNAWFDEPFGDLSALPTERVSALARRDSVVALSGDGGDELFGGYTWYERFWRFRRFNRWLGKRGNLPIPFRRPPSGLLQKAMNRLALLGQIDPLQLYMGVSSNLLSAELRTVREWLEIPGDYDYLWSLRPHYRPELGRFKSLQFLDFHTWLPDDLLTKVDRTSMAVSLEVRVPFLKRELCEFAFSLPEAFIYADGELKGGLKRAYREILPESILTRDKQGFGLPVGYWEDDVLEGEPSFVYYYLARLKRLGLAAAAP